MSVGAGTSNRRVVSLEHLTSEERVFIADSPADPGSEESVTWFLRNFEVEFPDVEIHHDTMRRFLTNLKRKKRRKRRRWQ